MMLVNSSLRLCTLQLSLFIHSSIQVPDLIKLWHSILPVQWNSIVNIANMNECLYPDLSSMCKVEYEKQHKGCKYNLPEIARSRLLFPHPEWPTISNDSPFSRLKLRPYKEHCPTCPCEQTIYVAWQTNRRSHRPLTKFRSSDKETIVCLVNSLDTRS